MPSGGYGAKKVTPEELSLAWGIVATEKELRHQQMACDQLLQRMKDIQQEAQNVEDQPRAELKRRLILIGAMARSIIERVEAGTDE